MAKQNIFVTVLNPGFIDTPMNDHRKFRPFLISSEKGAKIMTEISDLMLKEKDPKKLDISGISSWVFDLDNTICKTNSNNYLKSKPYKKVIKLISKL